MGQFLEMCNLPGLNHKELKNPNRPIDSKEKLRQPSRTSPKGKSPEPHGFTSELQQALKEDRTPNLLKLFQKCKEEAIVPHTFYEFNIPYYQNLGRVTNIKDNYRPIYLVNNNAKYQQMKHNNTLKR